MATVHIDLDEVVDTQSFHAAFDKALGFPSFYGRNMNAWEDVMSDISKPDVKGMTRVEVTRGEDLVLVLKGTREFRERQPDLFAALVDSTANVNRMKAHYESATRLLLRPE